MYMIVLLSDPIIFNLVFSLTRFDLKTSEISVLHIILYDENKIIQKT